MTLLKIFIVCVITFHGFAADSQKEYATGYRFSETLFERSVLRQHRFAPALPSPEKEDQIILQERPFIPVNVQPYKQLQATEFNAVYSHGTEASPLWHAGFLSGLAKEYGVYTIAPDHCGDNTYEGKPEIRWGSLNPRAEEICRAAALMRNAQPQNTTLNVLIGHSRGGATCVRVLGAKEKPLAFEHTLQKLYRNPQNLPPSLRGIISLSFGYESPLLDKLEHDYYAGSILFAPFGGDNFTCESLKSIKTPTLIFKFSHDKVSDNISETYGLMPNAKVVELPGTHWTCLDEGTSQNGNLTKDPDDVNRTDVHKRIKEEVGQFLLKLKEAQKKTLLGRIAKL